VLATCAYLLDVVLLQADQSLWNQPVPFATSPIIASEVSSAADSVAETAIVPTPPCESLARSWKGGRVIRILHASEGRRLHEARAEDKTLLTCGAGSVVGSAADCRDALARFCQ
jgi:hypothetical protein